MVAFLVMSRKLPNASEMGRKGGMKLREERGSRYFAEIGAKGRASIKKNDPDFYNRLSRAGVEARERKKALREKEQKSPLSKLTKLLTGS